MAITLDGTTGITTPGLTNTGTTTITDLTATGNTTLGDASTDTILMTGAPSIGGAGYGMGMGFRNRIINGAMVIDQRNAGAAVTINNAAVNQYTLDRFGAYNSTSAAEGIFTVQQDSSVPTGQGFRNSLKVAVTTADATLSAGQFYILSQRIEGFNVADLGLGTAAASTITFSFWTRSSLTGTFGGVLQNGGQNRSYPFSYSISVADTWEKKTITLTGDTGGTWLTTNGTGLEVIWGLGVGSTYLGTANAWVGSLLFGATGQVNLFGTSGNTFYITGVQLEKGSTATSFDYRPYGTELALCQRYAQPCGQGGSGRTAGATSVEITSQYRVPMRATATITFGGFSGAQTSLSQFGIGSVTASAVTSSSLGSSTGTYLLYTITGGTLGSITCCIQGDTSFANAEL
jgi:hypothetical protein